MITYSIAITNVDVFEICKERKKILNGFETMRLKWGAVGVIHLSPVVDKSGVRHYLSDPAAIKRDFEALVERL